MIDWLLYIVLALLLILLGLILLGVIGLILGWGVYAVVALYKGLRDLE